MTNSSACRRPCQAISLVKVMNMGITAGMKTAAISSHHANQLSAARRLRVLSAATRPVWVLSSGCLSRGVSCRRSRVSALRRGLAPSLIGLSLCRGKGILDRSERLFDRPGVSSPILRTSPEVLVAITALSRVGQDDTRSPGSTIDIAPTFSF
jgi:hypothetical protein